MNIEAHLLHWQEKDIMPYVVKHYKSFCDELIIHDNHSKDGSAEMAKELGCTVLPFGGDFFDDEINRDVKNNAWKGSKSDWIIFADFDELLFVDGVNERSQLSWYKELGVTLPETYGWQVMSDEWPVEKLTEITNGFHFANYSKNILFDPKEITDIDFQPGAHECKPKGNVVSWHSPLYVLHYKHIGGVQRTIDRYKVLQRRLSKNNRKKGYGCHYNRTPASIRQEWNERMKKSKPLI